VATDVGGVKEIIAHDFIGTTVPFGDGSALYQAIKQALEKDWDREKIAAYGQNRSWNKVADEVLETFGEIFQADKES